MSLAARLQAGPQRNTSCAVCILLSNLPDDEATALRAMLAAPWQEWSDEVTLAELHSEGHLLHLATAQTLGHHRRRCTT